MSVASGWILNSGSNNLRHMGLPADAVSRLNQCLASNWVLDFTVFSPNGGWVQVYNSGWYYNGAFPSDAANQIGKFLSQGLKIRSLVFGPTGGWLIVADGNHFANSPDFPQAVADDVADCVNNQGFSLLRVVFSPTYDGWCVIGDGGKYRFHGEFDPDSAAKTNELAKAGFLLKNIVFAPTGGWVLLFQNGWWYNGLPQTVVNEIADLLAQNHPMPDLAFSGVPLTFSLPSYICKTTRSTPNFGIGGDDTVFAQIDLQVGGLRFNQMTPNSKNVGSNSQPQEIDLSIGPILIPDPATRIVFAAQLANLGAPSGPVAQILKTAGDQLIKTGTDLLSKYLAGVIPYVGGFIGTGVGDLASLFFDGFFTNCDGPLVGASFPGTALNFVQLIEPSGSHNQQSEFLGDDNPKPAGRKSDYLLNWSVNTTLKSMTARMSPFPLTGDLPQTFTVTAVDSQSGEPIWGNVLISGNGNSQLGQPITHTFSAVIRTQRVAIPNPGGKPPVIWETQKIKGYDKALVVTADGYQDTSVNTGLKDVVLDDGSN